MPRPATFEEYLAHLVPPSVRGLDRRTLLTGRHRPGRPDPGRVRRQ